MEKILISYISFMLFLLSSCTNADKNEQLPEITGHNPKNKNARYLASAQGEMEGKLIRGSLVNYAMINEYDSSKLLLNQTILNNSMRIIQHFNSKGDVIQLETFNKDAPEIYQVNQYNDRGELLQEFRIEYSDDGADTILYEYHYQYALDSLSYVSFRTNNGDTVTRFTMEKKGNHMYKTEEAYPYRGFTIIDQQDITLNEKGKPIKITQTHISNHNEKDPVDTTYSYSNYHYDEAGRLIKESNQNDVLKAKQKSYEYKNGMISHMELDANSITFQQYSIAKND